MPEAMPSAIFEAKDEISAVSILYSSVVFIKPITAVEAVLL